MCGTNADAFSVWILFADFLSLVLVPTASAKEALNLHWASIAKLHQHRHIVYGGAYFGVDVDYEIDYIVGIC